MNQLEHFTYLAQTAEGQVFSDGMKLSNQVGIAIDPEQGLLVLSQGCSDIANPQQVMEILMDDMKVNLPPLESRDGSSDTELASRCLAESYENINEYLLDSPRADENPEKNCVALASIQLVNHRLSCAVVGDFCCLNYCAEKITTLNDIYDTHLRGDSALGLKTDFQMNITQHEILSGQVVFMAPLEVVQTVGEEHIRLTLSRFHDNLEMALRQINTRAAKRGLGSKPSLIFARVESSLKPKKGWLSRFRKKTPK